MKQPPISVIVPTYNEKESIRPFLKVLNEHMQSGYELIMVDDSSDDTTARFAEETLQKQGIPFKIVRRNKKGKGSAVRDGLAIANGDRIVIIDADLEYHPKEIQPMLAKLSEYDVVTVSRTFGSRRFLGLLEQLMVAFLFSITFETQSGLKVIRKSAKNIEFKTDRWLWDTEFIYQCLKKGLKVTTHEITYVPREQGESKVDPIHTSVENIFEFLKMRFRLH